MAVSTALKRKRHPSAQNQPVVALYGEFVIPVAAATYHLWEIPNNCRIIDAYVDVVVAGVHGAGNPAAELALLDKADAADPSDTAERIVAVADSNTASLTRMAGVGLQQKAVGHDSVLAYYRGTTQDTSGETIRVYALMIRDDLT